MYFEDYQKQQLGNLTSTLAATDPFAKKLDSIAKAKANKSSKLDTSLSNFTLEPEQDTYIDMLQYGLAGKAAGVSDTIMDVLGEGATQGRRLFTGEDEATATRKVHSLAQGNWLTKGLYDESMNYRGLDQQKTPEYYGYSPERTGLNASMEAIGKAYDTGSISATAGAVFDTAINHGVEVALGSSGEFVLGALGKAGLLVNAGDYSNKILEEREKLTGEPNDASDKALAMLAGAAMSFVNTGATKELFSNKAVVNKAANMIFETGSKSAIIDFTKVLVGKAATVTGKGVVEGSEEVVQDYFQAVGEKFGTEFQEELMNDEAVKGSLQAFAGGLGAGSTISATGQTLRSPVTAAEAIGAARTAYKYKHAADFVKDAGFSYQEARDSMLGVQDKAAGIEERKISGAAKIKEAVNKTVKSTASSTIKLNKIIKFIEQGKGINLGLEDKEIAKYSTLGADELLSLAEKFPETIEGVVNKLPKGTTALEAMEVLNSSNLTIDNVEARDAITKEYAKVQKKSDRALEYIGKNLDYKQQVKTATKAKTISEDITAATLNQTRVSSNPIAFSEVSELGDKAAKSKLVSSSNEVLLELRKEANTIAMKSTPDTTAREKARAKDTVRAINKILKLRKKSDRIVKEFSKSTTPTRETLKAQADTAVEAGEEAVFKIKKKVLDAINTIKDIDTAQEIQEAITSLRTKAKLTDEELSEYSAKLMDQVNRLEIPKDKAEAVGKVILDSVDKAIKNPKETAKTLDKIISNKVRELRTSEKVYIAKTIGTLENLGRLTKKEADALMGKFNSDSLNNIKEDIRNSDFAKRLSKKEREALDSALDSLAAVGTVTKEQVQKIKDKITDENVKDIKEAIFEYTKGKTSPEGRDKAYESIIKAAKSAKNSKVGKAAKKAAQDTAKAFKDAKLGEKLRSAGVEFKEAMRNLFVAEEEGARAKEIKALPQFIEDNNIEGSNKDC